MPALGTTTAKKPMFIAPLLSGVSADSAEIRWSAFGIARPMRTHDVPLWRKRCSGRSARAFVWS